MFSKNFVPVQLTSKGNTMARPVCWKIATYCLKFENSMKNWKTLTDLSIPPRYQIVDTQADVIIVEFPTYIERDAAFEELQKNAEV